MTIKSRTLILVLGLQLVALCAVAAYGLRAVAVDEAHMRELRAATETVARAQRIERIGTVLERAAIDLAALGSLLHQQAGGRADEAWMDRLQTRLLAHFETLPEALGGGLWFEPEAIESGRRHFGPYVFRDGGGLVFSWDLSSADYDYHSQPWYLAGLPRDWPRQRSRPRPVYWSEPYRDEAGSQALMLTAVAPVHDREGRVLGLATVDWALEDMLDLVEAMGRAVKGQAFLLDRRSGRLLVHTADPGQVMQPVALQAWATGLETQLRGDSLAFEADVELAGVPHQLHARGTAVGLLLGSLTPARVDSAVWLAALPKAFATAAALGLPFLLLVAWILNRQFSPVERLLQSIRGSLARAPQDGRLLLQPIPRPAQPELQPLVEALNGVFEAIHRDAEQLAELRRQIQLQQEAFSARQSSLEQRINERTFELEANNAELKRTVSALTQLQEQLVEAEKQGSLSRLVAGIAHDINTPLGIAVTTASHLLEVFLAQREALAQAASRHAGLRRLLGDGEEGLRMLLRNLERAAALVRSFKQISVDQSGEGRRQFELRPYLDDLLLSLRPQFKRLPHKVELDCPRGIELDSYPGAWAQIVTNLVMNALRHGLGAARPGHIRIAAAADDEQLTLVVSDDGVGIPAELLPRIFDAFFTTGAASGGTGLGLAVVRDLVEQRLGGRIEVRSAAGEGAEFRIVAPRRTPG